MRILVLSSTFPVEGIEGTPRFVETISAPLAPHHHVLVVTVARGYGGRSEYVTSSGLRIRVASRKGGRPTSGLLSTRSRPSLSEIWLVLKWLYAIISTTREFQPDVIHVHWLFPLPFVLRLAKGLRLVSRDTRIVVSGHGADVLMLGGRARRLMCWGLNAADQLTAVNERDAREIATAIQDTVPVSRLVMPIDEEFFEQASDSRRNLSRLNDYAFVGRLVQKKGVRPLCAAVRQARWPSGRHLVVLGDGPERAKLPLCNEIDYKGPASKQDIIEHLSKCRAIILPFIDVSGDREGLPVTILEACALGIPVITSRIAGVEDLVAQGFQFWFIEESNSPSSITCALEAFEQDVGREPSLIVESIRANQVLARKYRSDVTSMALLQLLV